MKRVTILVCLSFGIPQVLACGKSQELRAPSCSRGMEERSVH